MVDSRSIVILTGAGISAESGIQTFRASDGLWNHHRVEDVATPEGFAANPSLVQEFYNQRRQQLMTPQVQPNAAHVALAKLEQDFAGNVLIVTQNIDNLHSQAGSKNVIHMHGELLKVRCLECDHVQVIEVDVDPSTACQSCHVVGEMRPDIVWFGEMPMSMPKIEAAIVASDLFLSIGTSGNVYPATGFVQMANDAGAVTWELNLEPSAQRTAFSNSQYGPATEVVPAFVEKLLQS